MLCLPPKEKVFVGIFSVALARKVNIWILFVLDSISYTNTSNEWERDDIWFYSHDEVCFKEKRSDLG